RAAVFFPAAASAISFLQASRNTCVMRAQEGTIEHDDFSTEPAPAPELAASRRVAKGIYRDSILIGIAAGALAAATALVRRLSLLRPKGRRRPRPRQSRVRRGRPSRRNFAVLHWRRSNRPAPGNGGE